MSAELKTKYTNVYVSSDDADPKQNYFGYMSISFDITNETANFFMESVEYDLLKEVRDFFKHIPNYNPEKDVTMEDGSILINLVRVADKKYAPDLLRMVKNTEEAFNSKAGL